MKQNIVLGVIMLLFTSGGYGNQYMPQTSYNCGNQSYGKETLEAVQANGTLSLEGTTVLRTVQVNGRLQAYGAVMGTLQVNGKATLKQCSIDGETHINGSLTADGTKFQNDLSVASEKISLNNCILENVTIRPEGVSNNVQIIELGNETKVFGSITVESGNGEVWLSSDSAISGDVIGARLIKK